MREEPKFPVMMPLRYPDVCRNCGRTITKGAVALWKGRKSGVTHIRCKKLLASELDW